MSKRFSMKEMALLTAPVLVIVALGWWHYKRAAQVNAKRPFLSIRVEKPTTLQAFRGADLSCVVTVNNLPASDSGMSQMFPYVEVKTPYGTEVGRKHGDNEVEWNKDLWNDVSNSSRQGFYLLKTANIPDGETRFGAFVVVPPSTGDVSPSSLEFRAKPLRLSGQWKIDHAQLKPMNLQSWPRKPLISLREVKIVRQSVGGVTGVAIFQLEGAPSSVETSMEINFINRRSNIGWHIGSPIPNLKTPRQREVEWTVTFPPATMQHITGRVSADNRWPLSFEIEPFSFKTVKVGQKLKFKQFPVPLPKN